MPIIESSSYRAPCILKNRHLQTIYQYMFRMKLNLNYERKRFSTADGDFLELDWVKTGSKKLVVLCHGLESNSRESHILGMARKFISQGWDALALNYRGCGGEPNRDWKSYHYGFTDDLREVLEDVSSSGEYEDIVLVGFSLGGNIALKYLGEEGDKLKPLIKGAVCFSIPCDIADCAGKLSEPSNAIYFSDFLNRFYNKYKEKNKILNDRLDLGGFKKIKTFRELDSRYTGPIHGFKDVDRFWEESSCKNWLNRIAVPTLIVNAQDDPFLDKNCYPIELCRNSDRLFLEIPDFGGHCGFVSFNREREYWSEQRAMEFIINMLMI